MSGEVTIELDGKQETLRSTLRAARLVNNLGGFAEVFRKLAVFDLDTYIAVVAAGLNKKPTEVDDAVYATGLPSLIAPLSTYVEYLSNGGRPIKAPKEGDGSGEA